MRWMVITRKIFVQNLLLSTFLLPSTHTSSSLTPLWVANCTCLCSGPRMLLRDKSITHPFPHYLYWLICIHLITVAIGTEFWVMVTEMNDHHECIIHLSVLQMLFQRRTRMMIQRHFSGRVEGVLLKISCQYILINSFHCLQEPPVILYSFWI